MPSLSDFSGVLRLVAPTGGVTTGTPVQVQSVWYLPVSGVNVSSATAAVGEAFSAQAMWAHNNKILKNATKTAGTAWTAGQKVYIASDGSYSTVASGNTLAGVAAADAASAAVLGDVVLGAPI